MLAPFAATNAVAAGEIGMGSVAQYVGRLEYELGRHDAAETHYARMLLTRAAPDDGKRAATLLSQAISTYDELGMRGSASRARAVAASPSTRRRR